MERGPIIARILCAAGRWVRTRWVWAPRGGAAGRWSELGAGPPGHRQCAWADILSSDRPPSISAVVGNVAKAVS